MSVLRYAVLSLAVLAMVWPATPPDTRAGLSGSAWRVVEIEGAQAAETATLRFTLSSVRGKAACTSFFGAFREHNGAIEIAGLFDAPQACKGQTPLERGLLNVLARVKAYRLDGGMLVLMDDSGKAIVKLMG